MTVRAETKDGKRVEVVKFEMTDTGEYRFKIYLEDEREGYEMYSFADIFQIAKALTDLKEDGTFRVQFLNNVKPYQLDPKSMTVEAI